MSLYDLSGFTSVRMQLPGLIGMEECSVAEQFAKPYFYDAEGNVLHLSGCCKNSQSSAAGNILFFDSAHEALSFAGTHCRWCEECLAHRENIRTAFALCFSQAAEDRSGNL